MSDFVYATRKRCWGHVLIVEFSDGSTKMYNAVELGCRWFRMTNDAFYNLYGFNFTPFECGLYEYCRKLVHGE